MTACVTLASSSIAPRFICRDKISRLNPELANPLVRLASLLVSASQPLGFWAANKPAKLLHSFWGGGQTLALTFGQAKHFMH